MWTKIVFLGTSAAVPTKHRSLPSIALIRNGKIALFDVGEGAQYRLLEFGLSPLRIRAIYITHHHGDHVFGLPGLIHTMNMYGASETLKIYAPRSVLEFLEETFSLSGHRPIFPLEMIRLDRSSRSRFQDITVSWFPVEHGCEAYGFVIEQDPKPGRFNVEAAVKLGVPKGPLWKKLQMGEDVMLPNGRVVRSRDVVGEPRPGPKIVYTGDTMPAESVVSASVGADVLIHDATFAEDMAEEAHEQGHSTSLDAAETARRARVFSLVLTHISARYKSTDKLLEDARRVFERVVVAEDGLTIYVA